MTDIAEGFWPCKVINGSYGDVERKPGVWINTVRVNVEVTEGSHAGQRFTYEEEVNNKQIPYIVRTIKAVGWKCHDMTTLADDIDAWVKATGGISTLEIKHWERKRGPHAGTTWAKPNSIGRGPKPIKAASKDNLLDANAMARMALAEDAARGYGDANLEPPSGGNGYSDPPTDDIPPPSDGDEPPPF